MKVKSLRAVSFWKTGAVDKAPGFYSGQAVTGNFPLPLIVDSHFSASKHGHLYALASEYHVTNQTYLGMERVGPQWMLPDGNQKPFALLVVDM